MKNIILIIVCFLFISRTQTQPTDQIIERSGAKINFRIIGDGKPILLLSGGPGFSLDYMTPVADLLSNSFQCILLDQRGIGKS